MSKKLLSALVSMWVQYCPDGHAFMSAGEEAWEVLDSYGLMLDRACINWDRYAELMGET